MINIFQNASIDTAVKHASYGALHFNAYVVMLRNKTILCHCLPHEPNVI